MYSVIQGKTIDEIYTYEKQKIESFKNKTKISGYITAEDYKMRKIRCTVPPLSSSSLSIASTSTSNITNNSNEFRISQSSDYLSQLSQNQANSLQLSTSKNNENFTVLRENVDSEQRQKSAQKPFNFSGKNQKNVSPYRTTTTTNSTNLNQQKILANKNANILKAKRQISFDC